MTASAAGTGNSTRLMLAALLVISCFFALFWRLDGSYLWRDEATTSVWARTMAETNSLVPRVFDGTTVSVQGFDAHDFNDSLTPGMQGWLQFYVTALSFKLLGVSTFSARFPFAVAGLLSVLVFWFTGRRLYGNSNLAFLFPFIAVTSIAFLTATRQSRYYGLLVLFGALLIYEFVRYLQDRSLGANPVWFLRVALWSAGVYLSNYLGFAGLYTALCFFVMLQRDLRFFLRWSVFTVVLGVLFGAEFFAFHFDFASSWGSAPQPWEDPDATFFDKLLSARNLHALELFRMIPFLFLVPGVFFALRQDVWRDGRRGIPTWPVWVSVALMVTVFFGAGNLLLTVSMVMVELLTAALILLYLRARRRTDAAAAAQKERLSWALPVAIGAVLTFGLAIVYTSNTALLRLAGEMVFIGLTAYAVIRLRPRADREMPVLHGLVMLCALILGVSVLVTIAVGLDKGIPRYYYHVLAAVFVMLGIAAAEILKRNRTAGAVFLAGVLIWPNLNYNVYTAFAIVERQWSLNRTIDYPVVEFLRQHSKPGDRIVFFRNVQGMMAHFYLPDRRWVGQLDSENERALYFKDRIPADAYDTAGDIDWYVVWNNYNRLPRGLDDRYEKVFDYTYHYPVSWWDLRRGAKDERRWRVYKRKADAPVEPTGRPPQE